MADNDPIGNFMNMFQQFGENLKLPTAEVGDIVDFHRKNIQALQAAAAASSAGAQTAMAKQREALERTLAEAADMIKDARNQGDASQMMSNQAEFTQKAFEATIRNSTEMSEIVRDSGTESFKIIQARVEESIAELRDKMGNKG